MLHKLMIIDYIKKLNKTNIYIIFNLFIILLLLASLLFLYNYSFLFTDIYMYFKLPIEESYSINYNYLDDYLLYKNYKIVLVAIFISFILSYILYMINILLGTNTTEFDKEKVSAYECGFEPFEDTKQLIDIRVLKIAVLFLIFDIELIFFLPWLFSFKLALSFLLNIGLIYYILSGISFFILLVLGLAYELRNFFFKERI